jgi:hypothetical protein
MAMRDSNDLLDAIECFCGDQVWVDPVIDAEWRDVVDTYFADWDAAVGCDFDVYLSARLRLEGEIVDGLCLVDVGAIVVRAGAIRHSRPYCRSILVHEACHAVVGCEPHDGQALPPDVRVLLDHGPRWQQRMAQAIGDAYDSPEPWLAERLVEDMENELAEWADVSPAFWRWLWSCPGLIGG